VAVYYYYYYYYYYLLQLGFDPVEVVQTKQQNSYKTRKVSRRTEHRKYKYNTFNKTRELKTTTAQETH
jgi:hypothetical protein